MAFHPVPSPAEIIRLYHAEELAAELARYHETAADDEEPFIAQCISLHNAGEIDLLRVVDTPAFTMIEGHDFFTAQHLYCEAIPKLRAELRALMLCCNALVKQAGRDGAATQPNSAFQKWCVANREHAQTAIDQARTGDELARQFVTFALRSLNEIDEAMSFVDAFTDDRRISGMIALPGMTYRDSTEAHKVIATLGKFVTADIEDNVRLNALLAAFDILKNYPKATTATALVDAAVKEAGPATLHALAQIIWLHHTQLDRAMLTTVLDALRGVSSENLGTVNILDLALCELLRTTEDDLALSCLTDILRNGPLTLVNFDSVARLVARSDPQRRYVLAMRWLLSGSSKLCRNVNDLVGIEKDRPFDATAASLGLTTAQQLFVCRKAIGFLFVKPVVCCSIIVSVLRNAHPEAVNPLVELLFDPMLLNYGGKTKEYLKSISPTDAAYAAVQIALAKDEAFHKDLDTVGIVKELRPSDYQRDVVRQFTHDEMRKVHKLAESKSLLLSFVHRSTILYGKQSLTYITDPSGERRAIAMDLKPFGTSFELPRHQILDPVGLDYILRIFRAQRLE